MAEFMLEQSEGSDTVDLNYRDDTGRLWSILKINASGCIYRWEDIAHGIGIKLDEDGLIEINRGYA